MNIKGAQQVQWNEEKVDKEVKLLKKAREMTRQS